MKATDLYTRVLLSVITGCLVYIAGCLHVLLKQPVTYATQAASPTTAVPAAWRNNPTLTPPAVTRVYIAGLSWRTSEYSDWTDVAFSGDGSLTIPVKCK